MNRNPAKTLLFAASLAAGLSIFGCELLVNDRRGEKPGDAPVYVKTNPVGTSARALLAGDIFRSVVVEIQHVKGFAPPQEALNRYQAFLEKHLNKEKIEIRQPVEIAPLAVDSYGVPDVRALEARNRADSTEKNRLALYFLFLDRPSRDDLPGGQRVMAQAYQNTSVVIYQSTLRELLDAQAVKPPMGLFEATVMAHETGHLLGLVNNGIAPVQSEHHDATNGHHCNKPNCLMHASAESVDVLANLTNGQLPDFDSFCLQDLKAAGGK